MKFPHLEFRSVNHLPPVIVHFREEMGSAQTVKYCALPKISGEIWYAGWAAGDGIPDSKKIRWARTCFVKLITNFVLIGIVFKFCYDNIICWKCLEMASKQFVFFFYKFCYHCDNHRLIGTATRTTVLLVDRTVNHLSSTEAWSVHDYTVRMI